VPWIGKSTSMPSEFTNKSTARLGELFSVYSPGSSNEPRGHCAWISPPDAHARSFLRDGPSREIHVGNERFVLRDRKGHRYISVLLARPYQSVTAVDLKAMDDGRDAREFAGSCGAEITREGIEELRTRYQSLRQDLEEATEAGHVTRQEHIAREITRIAEECNRSTDRRGRPRERSDAEKVRLAVTNAVRRAIWSIGGVAPLVKQYFTRTIVTGHLLMFRPLGDETWNV
jgi:hypothetical protein